MEEVGTLEEPQVGLSAAVGFLEDDDDFVYGEVEVAECAF
jgi:hypothetical protein